MNNNYSLTFRPTLMSRLYNDSLNVAVTDATLPNDVDLGRRGDFGKGKFDSSTAHAQYPSRSQARERLEMAGYLDPTASRAQYQPDARLNAGSAAGSHRYDLKPVDGGLQPPGINRTSTSKLGNSKHADLSVTYSSQNPYSSRARDAPTANGSMEQRYSMTADREPRSGDAERQPDAVRHGNRGSYPSSSDMGLPERRTEAASTKRLTSPLEQNARDGLYERKSGLEEHGRKAAQAHDKLRSSQQAVSAIERVHAQKMDPLVAASLYGTGRLDMAESTDRRQRDAVSTDQRRGVVNGTDSASAKRQPVKSYGVAESTTVENGRGYSHLNERCLMLSVVFASYFG